MGTDPEKNGGQKQEETMGTDLIKFFTINSMSARKNTKNDKKCKNAKTGVVFGLLVFFIILLGIWYFLGMPGIENFGLKKTGTRTEGTDLVFINSTETDKSISSELKEKSEKVIDELKQVVKETAESVQKALDESSLKNRGTDLGTKGTDPEFANIKTEGTDLEKSINSEFTNNATKFNHHEFSSEECDLNHPENSPLFFGNPSDCIESLESDRNYLLEKPQFIISYNNDTLCPNWVGWHLSILDLGDADRSNKFAPDKSLPAIWHQVSKNDYQFNAYGFDRGHICPSADRTATQLDNEITFLMTNMVPQAPDCNRIVWMHLENYERELAKKGNELYIFAGPYGTGGVGQKGEFNEIPVTTKGGQTLTINVPSFTWKIIMILSDGAEDFSRVTENTEILSVCVPNVQGCGKNGDWEQYLCSVDYIEDLTGYDFFELLPDTIEDVLEARIYEFKY